MEAELKREITRIHKDIIGKGPGSTSIKIFENVVFVKLQDIFSPFEISLLEIPDGEKRLKEIRMELFESYGHELIEMFTNHVDCSLEDVLSNIDEKKGIAYILLILDKDVESCFD